MRVRFQRRDAATAAAARTEVGHKVGLARLVGQPAHEDLLARVGAAVVSSHHGRLLRCQRGSKWPPGKAGEGTWHARGDGGGQAAAELARQSGQCRWQPRAQWGRQAVRIPGHRRLGLHLFAVYDVAMVHDPVGDDLRRVGDEPEAAGCTG